MENIQYNDFRTKYKNFYYENYHLENTDDSIKISFDFSIDGLAKFNPNISIPKKKFKFFNDITGKIAKKIVFYMGMVELISYWKCACPQNVIINCGHLSDHEILWWKKLYFNGLGEFFYTNNITPNFDDFMIISSTDNSIVLESDDRFNFSDKFSNIIPIGGGKDSIVSIELLSKFKSKNLPLIINPRGASSETAHIAGYLDDEILEIYRTIDKNLLDLNKKGFLNGHTPFSAMLGFTSVFCSFFLGIPNIALSNESSANESNIKGTNINHQYSKSFEFELDFSNYVHEHINTNINYFSLLRPFSELKIAQLFSRHKKYFNVFKSCNVGSKQDIWCGHCPKCLFVYIMLLPFVDVNDLIGIFGKDMLDDISLSDTFSGLIGLSEVKPFECVGTIEEVNYALNLSYEKHYKNTTLPKLLDFYFKNYHGDKYLNSNALSCFNKNNIPKNLLNIVGEYKND